MLIENKNFDLNKIIGISLFSLGLILLSVMLYFGLNPSIWFDEAFTFNIVTMPFQNMLIATAIDVHPPLYYIIVQIVFKFLSLFSFTFNIFDSFNIITGKLISVIPLVCLLGFSFTKLRKEFDWLTCGIFALLQCLK